MPVSSGDEYLHRPTSCGKYWDAQYDVSADQIPFTTP